ncbi:hypothetical protein C791_8139 [Amycolatopsis azurea DSM 43854]|uniref:Uncharacterized protein n=1 Tax=Amycolatopsis azurea DSM 43854 TaxID=1238180 RepID=M2QPV2_9PSEU|nr:hypothetical protein C791_8139 [Amycolatopsis azurea DSM 43854]
MTVLEGLAAGTIDLAFRRWSNQNVHPGDVMRLEAGVIEVESVEVVDPATITDADARRSGAESASAQRGGRTVRKGHRGDPRPFVQYGQTPLADTRDLADHRRQPRPPGPGTR